MKNKLENSNPNQDLDAYWSEKATQIEWFKPYDKVIDESIKPIPRWFVGGQLNTCHNALDRHVNAGRGKSTALIYDSAMTGEKLRFSYQMLLDATATFAGAMARQGISKGDRVIIYMPMIPQAIVAMLACARLGAIHSVVFGGFAAAELAARIDDVKPKLIVTASCGLEPDRIIEYKPLVDDAINQAIHPPEVCVVWQRREVIAKIQSGRDHNWFDFIASAKPHDCVPVAATDPLYILYTSGTTGQAKGIVRDNGGHAVALNWSMKYIYDIEPNDIFWAASDIGWVVGHSYIVYGPLLKGATTLLYEGKSVGTPDAGAFWRVAEEYKVNCLLTAPSAIRAIKAADPNAKLLESYNLSYLKSLFLAGERCDPETLNWSQKVLGVPVIDHWWQTETGWSIAATPLGNDAFKTKLGAAGKAMPGWNVEVLDDNGRPVKKGEIGSIVCRLPLAPSSLVNLWNAESRFIESYFADYPGYYKTGDAGYIDEEGYIFVMTRTDDIINVAGHRLSTGAIEDLLATHPDVAECAVIGIKDSIKGHVPLGLLCLKTSTDRPHEQIIAESIALIRLQIGAVASFKNALIVKRLPKTRSGKVLRATIRKIADGEAYETPATIDDPAILDEIEEALK